MDAAVDIAVKQAGGFEHAQVLGDGGKRDAKRLREFGDGGFAESKAAKNGAAGGVRERAESGVQMRWIVNHMV